MLLPVNGRFAVDREFVYIAVPLLKHFVGASWCKLAIWVSLGPSWVSLGRPWRQDMLQEASKLRSRGDPNRIWGHLGAKKAPNAATSKMVIIFREIVPRTLQIAAKINLPLFCAGSTGSAGNGGSDCRSEPPYHTRRGPR